MAAWCSLQVHRGNQCGRSLVDVVFFDEGCEHRVERRQLQRVAEIRDRIVADDMSVLENDHAGAYLLDNLERVGAQDYHLAFGGERAYERLQHASSRNVQTRERLVENDDARV